MAPPLGSGIGTAPSAAAPLKLSTIAAVAAAAAAAGFGVVYWHTRARSATAAAAAAAPSEGGTRDGGGSRAADSAWTLGWPWSIRSKSREAAGVEEIQVGSSMFKMLLSPFRLFRLGLLRIVHLPASCPA